MKKFIFIFLIHMIWSISASAEIYDSPFGFNVNFSSHWLIVNGQKLKELKDEHDSIFKSLSDIAKDRRLIEQLKKQSLKGEIEIYYNLKTSDEYSLDNISVRKTIKDFSLLLKECSGLSAKLSGEFGRSIEVYECGYKKIGNLSGFFVDFDGVISGTRIFAFYFLNSRNEVIAMGGSCKNRVLKTFRKEFDDIIASLKIR